MLCQLRVRYEGNIIRSISYVDVLSYKDFEKILGIYLERWSLLAESYKDMNITNIEYVYKIVDTSFKGKIVSPIYNRKVDHFKLKDIFKILPQNMDYKS